MEGLHNGGIQSVLKNLGYGFLISTSLVGTLSAQSQDSIETSPSVDEINIGIYEHDNGLSLQSVLSLHNHDCANHDPNGYGALTIAILEDMNSQGVTIKKHKTSYTVQTPQGIDTLHKEVMIYTKDHATQMGNADMKVEIYEWNEKDTEYQDVTVFFFNTYGQTGFAKPGDKRNKNVIWCSNRGLIKVFGALYSRKVGEVFNVYEQQVRSNRGSK